MKDLRCRSKWDHHFLRILIYQDAGWGNHMTSPRGSSPLDIFTKRPLYFYITLERPLYFAFLLKPPLTNGQAVHKVTTSSIFF